jgi:hypothetical protein
MSRDFCLLLPVIETLVISPDFAGLVNRFHKEKRPIFPIFVVLEN